MPLFFKFITNILFLIVSLFAKHLFSDFDLFCTNNLLHASFLTNIRFDIIIYISGQFAHLYEHTVVAKKELMSKPNITQLNST